MRRPVLIIVVTCDTDKPNEPIDIKPIVMDQKHYYASEAEAQAAMLMYLRAVAKCAAVEIQHHGLRIGLSQKQIEDFLMASPEPELFNPKGTPQ